MNLKELQALAQKEKSRIIIVENGEPILVVIPYEEYKRQGSINNTAPDQEPGGPLEEENVAPGELTIDDLPL